MVRTLRNVSYNVGKISAGCPVILDIVIIIIYVAVADGDGNGGTRNFYLGATTSGVRPLMGSRGKASV